MQRKPNRFAALGLLGLSALGCSTEDGAAGKPSLVRASAQFVSDTCADGGHKLEAGVDTNGNAELDDDEVRSSSFVCDGAVGRAGQNTSGTRGKDGASAALTAVELSDEPANGACASGGQRVDIGVDANADGKIDAGAHVNTTYVCSGDAGATGTDGAQAKIAVTPEPAGANCPNGGKRLDYGLDASGDGVRQASEIIGTRYACDGAAGVSGRASLFLSTPEPAGLNCANGGQRLDEGRDADGNGTLDVAEISGTSYTCNGAAGDDGVDGADGASHLSLVDVVAEPAGANCAAGGSKITYGVDADGDSSLDPAEVKGARYACNGTAADDGLLELVSVTVEPPGGACTGGGHAVKIGLDDNRNETLDLGEVDSLSYICDFDAFQNPSFELPSYQGWTVTSTSDGQWLLVNSGTTLHAGDVMFDYADEQNEELTSIGLPYTVTSTNGTVVAVQQQSNPGIHRIYQDFTVPRTATSLTWDMYYKNTFNKFVVDSQYIAINIRKPADDSVIATLYKTKVGDPLVLAGMTPFSADLSAYAGHDIRFDIETNIQWSWIDVALDNFKIY